MAAAKEGKLDVVELLLTAGANIYATNNVICHYYSLLLNHRIV